MSNLLSVTTVLSPFNDFSKIPPDVLQYAADRGSLVHRLNHSIALGYPILEEIPADSIGFVASFRGWFEKRVEVVRIAEAEFIDDQFQFVGHPDLICRLYGDDVDTIVDYKTPAIISKTWAGQMAAYRRLANGNGYPVGRAIVLRLNKMGLPPLVHEYSDDGRELAAFLGALTAYRFFAN